MIATRDFTARIDGVDYALKQGEAFHGTRHAEWLLKQQGLIQRPKPTKGKGETK